MKTRAMFRLVVLIAGLCALAMVAGCGGGGGGGGSVGPVAPSITTASLPAGVRGQLYSTVVAATAGTTPYTWSVSTGPGFRRLPAGVTLNTATGVVSGTPTDNGTFTPVFTVTDHGGLSDNATLTLVVNPPPSPSVSTTSLPGGVRTQAYSAQLAATSGAPPYSWTVSTGPGVARLPAGVTLSSSGALSGTPTEEGAFTPTFTVTDNNAMTGSRQISVAIAAPPSPSVSTASLPSGVRGDAYSAQLLATSGTPPYTWDVSTGPGLARLPAGVTLDAGTGALTGTPTEEGTFTPTFTVTDGNLLTGNRQLTLLINPPASPVINTTALPDGARTEPYAAALSATGGTPPYTWSVSTGPGLARLPAGVTLNTATGALTGTPTDNGTFSPVFTVTDSLAMAATKSIGILIAKPLVLCVADYDTPSGAIAVFDNASVADGASAWTRRLKGALTTLDNNVGGPPAGASYDAARNILYAARTPAADNGAVLAFNNANTANGNVAPSRVIRTYSIGPNVFHLEFPTDVYIDGANDRLYIADYTGAGSGTVIVLDNASTAPAFRKVFGFNAGPPAGISLDAGRNTLYIAPSLGTKIVAYDNVSGSTGGIRTITIGGVTGVGVVDVKVDPASDTAYIADYSGGRVLVINNASQKNGTYTPDRTLTGLSNPNSVFPDAANNRLFVSNRDGATSYSVGVVENMSSVNGAVTFSRQLSGFGMAAGMTGFYK